MGISPSFPDIFDSMKESKPKGSLRDNPYIFLYSLSISGRELYAKIDPKYSQIL
jgi:hypothetical protein